MKKRLVFWFVVFVLISSGVFNGSDATLMAQVSREVPIGTPIAGPIYPIKGPAEGILKLEIRDGLKRFLLADLYAQHGEYDQALEIVDYTKPVTVLDKELAVEKDSELIRLLEYQQQKIESMKRALPTPVPTLLETVKSRADAEYQNMLYLKKHKKPAQAIQSALIALKFYQDIESVAGQLLVRYQLALLYTELGDKAEAVRQAQEFITLDQQLELIKKYEEMQELLKE